MYIVDYTQEDINKYSYIIVEKSSGLVVDFSEPFTQNNPENLIERMTKSVQTKFMKRNIPYNSKDFTFIYNEKRGMKNNN